MDRNEAPIDVLVVDDDEDYRMLWRLLLEGDAGIGAVHEAAGGRAAMEVLAGVDEIDIVLADLWMPEIGGYDVLDCARLCRPELPVVLTSCATGVEREAMDRGATSYLDKPRTVCRDLASLLREVVSRDRPLFPVG